MKIAKLSMLTSAVIAATLSATVIAGHHEEKIIMGFSAMDKDGNGYIVGSETSGVIDSKLLSKMDTDGDSMISRAEFNKFVDEKPAMFSDDIITQVKTEGTNDALLTEQGNPELFSKADGEMISEKNKELRTEMSATADDKFTKIDVNSDGKLTADELKIAHVAGDFEMMDENGDSYVTRMEYRAYFEGLESN
ncbi:EF-hand domain-containing protein [Alteromonas gracilis]|uniref:EF-hand domain-containing protein n=1 Tax=Alteromonas gracilis TaxID=1479524 RepID=UPI003734EE4F